MNRHTPHTHGHINAYPLHTHEHIHTHWYPHGQTHTHAQTHTHWHTHEQTHTHAHTHTHWHTHEQETYTNKQTHTNKRTDTHTRAHLILPHDQGVHGISGGACHVTHDGPVSAQQPEAQRIKKISLWREINREITKSASREK